MATSARIARSPAYQRAVKLIRRADDGVPLREVLKLTGIGWTDGPRADCPVCGEIRALIVHDEDNWAWCHSCGRGYGPVSLYAAYQHGDDIPRGARLTAARELAGRYGITPGPGKDRPPPEPDRHVLSAALIAWCERTFPDWRRQQYDPVVAGKLARCLGLLPLVHTEQDCRDWLTAARTAMGRVLGTEAA